MGRFTIALLIISFPFLPCSKAQDISKTGLGDPYFTSWGASTFIDYIQGPPTIYETGGAENFIQDEGFSYFTIAYRGRMNLAEFFPDLALSSSVIPATGVSFFRGGFMHFNLPMFLNLELGANSTKNAEMGGFGLVGGIGYEFHAAPIFVNRGNLPLPSGTNVNNTWLQPVYTVGIRYERRGRLMEINLKYGEGTGEFTAGQTVRSRTIRIMAYYFL